MAKRMRQVCDSGGSNPGLFDLKQEPGGTDGSSSEPCALVSEPLFWALSLVVIRRTLTLAVTRVRRPPTCPTEAALGRSQTETLTQQRGAETRLTASHTHLPLGFPH